MARRLPTSRQIEILENRCVKFNDNCDEIDFVSEVDSSLTFGENEANIISLYPQFIWEDPDPKVPVKFYEEQVIDQLRSEAEPYSYDIIKGYKLEELKRDSRRAVRLGKKLEACESRPTRPPSRPGKCRVRTVEVREHTRCPPRRG